MTNLTSRKLVATLAGLIAIGTVAGFATFGGLDGDVFSKALGGVLVVTLSAIGAQALLDSKNGTS